ncbi:unnamed protein product [Rotaria sp. Silwood1]|nr:unnamed protein product [Rotaria sp. Silwood1]CAF0853362.1 unnamed protein product [Rotaria sp. Silwood1]CAF0868925.1 unnamed protein product [Rotaria sp. Silwood1]CAF3353574.1 unnamed protein product [Rotaria sp. Silwood1]
MASFIMKQMMGSQLDKVKELAGGDGEKKDGGNGSGGGGDDEEDPEVAEARREADEKRNAKYAKMERQREEVRQNIREKYNIKKKEESAPLPCEGRLTADKKGPIPLPDDDDSFDPIKMATEALNTITEKLPFKLPWK